MARCRRIKWTLVLLVWFVAVLVGMLVWFIRSCVQASDSSFPEDQNPWAWDLWDFGFGAVLFVLATATGVILSCPYGPARLLVRGGGGGGGEGGSLDGLRYLSTAPTTATPAIPPQATTPSLVVKASRLFKESPQSSVYSNPSSPPTTVSVTVERLSRPPIKPRRIPAVAMIPWSSTPTSFAEAKEGPAQWGGPMTPAALQVQSSFEDYGAGIRAAATEDRETSKIR